MKKKQVERFIIHFTAYKKENRKKELKVVRKKKGKEFESKYRKTDVTIVSKYFVCNDEDEIEKKLTKEIAKYKKKKGKQDITVNQQRFTGNYRFTKRGTVFITKGDISPAVKSYSFSSKSSNVKAQNIITDGTHELMNVESYSVTQARKKKKTRKEKLKTTQAEIVAKKESKKERVIREETEYLLKLSKRKKKNVSSKRRKNTRNGKGKNAIKRRNKTRKKKSTR